MDLLFYITLQSIYKIYYSTNSSNFFTFNFRNLCQEFLRQKCAVRWHCYGKQWWCPPLWPGWYLVSLSCVDEIVIEMGECVSPLIPSHGLLFPRDGNGFFYSSHLPVRLPSQYFCTVPVKSHGLIVWHRQSQLILRCPRKRVSWLPWWIFGMEYGPGRKEISR